MDIVFINDIDIVFNLPNRVIGIFTVWTLVSIFDTVFNTKFVTVLLANTKLSSMLQPTWDSINGIIDIGL